MVCGCFCRPSFPGAFAGWGLVWTADGLARRFEVVGSCTARAGGSRARLRGVATRQGPPFRALLLQRTDRRPCGSLAGRFELSYWYDAFNDRTLAELNARLPKDAAVAFSNDQSEPSMLFQDLQSLGKLRRDIEVLP